ncbi:MULTISPECIES: rhodanese-like domain-containing protein [Rhodomicrobium]|uniref:rhodanese-like domain-containing protein n=1 Tax=Rhodomicrobium TaxID=1068 RepID=UPI000B4B938F|nr:MULTISPECIES: rhodanese-like domain-containing protein [Rhodomicrobium]
MPKAMKIGYDALIEAARREITELEPEQVMAAMDGGGIVIIDVRDIREIEREGRIPGSFHCPRGMLEFWIDPGSPYFKPVFGEQKRFVFHCALDWRSALSTQTAQRMGLENVAHMKGGFKAWRDADGPVEMVAAEA